MNRKRVLRNRKTEKIKIITNEKTKPNNMNINNLLLIFIKKSRVFITIFFINKNSKINLNNL